jgi:hypothetical protein
MKPPRFPIPTNPSSRYRQIRATRSSPDSRQRDLAGAQAFASGGEMIGEPGQRMMGMAEHVGAGAAEESKPTGAGHG